MRSARFPQARCERCCCAPSSTLPAGVLSNTAAVSSDTPDPDPSNNTDTAVTAVGTSADLSVRKAALPDPATAGETLTYLLNVSNAGPDAAQNVVVTDPLSAALQNAEFSVQGGAFMPWTGSYAARCAGGGRQSPADGPRADKPVVYGHADQHRHRFQRYARPRP